MWLEKQQEEEQKRDAEVQKLSRSLEELDRRMTDLNDEKSNLKVGSNWYLATNLQTPVCAIESSPVCVTELLARIFWRIENRWKRNVLVLSERSPH